MPRFLAVCRSYPMEDYAPLPVSVVLTWDDTLLYFERRAFFVRPPAWLRFPSALGGGPFHIYGDLRAKVYF